MRNLTLVAVVVVWVMALGSVLWTYEQKIQTRQAELESKQLQQSINEAEARINMLEAEWAYLNRPDRLLALAGPNIEVLGLVELRAAQFGTVDQIAFAPIEEREGLTPDYRLAQDWGQP